MIYQGFARVYDRLMTDTPYDVWYGHFKEIISKNNITGKDVLELACGTGEMTQKMVKDGYKVLGTDLSEEMLEIAQQKAYEAHLKVRYILQDMTDLELFQKYDIITSFCDGFNYLLDYDDLKKTLTSCYDYLNDGGYLIFDMSSDYKLKTVLGQNVIAETTDDVAFIWENYYDDQTKVLEFDLTLFEKSNNHYVRYDEVHKQRAYTMNEIIEEMQTVGFEVIEVMDTDTGEAVRDQSERWLFVGRK